MLEIKLLPGSMIEIVGEILADDFEACREQATKELSEKINIDGFRPGKVPENILIKNVGEQKILEKTALIALQREYLKIIVERKIRAIGHPVITITKIARHNPLGFNIKTPVMPEISLPDYKKISQEVKNEDKEKRRIEILEKIAEKIKEEIPAVLIEGEKEKMTEEELKKDWEPDALKRVKFGLILNEIAEKEQIEVSKEDVEKEAQKIIEVHKNIDPERIRAYTYGIIRNEKVLNLLESC